MPDTSTSHDIDAAWHIISAGAEQGAYAGAVAVVAHHGRIVLERACGYAVLEPERIPMSTTTRFDLASLTKVVATLPAILRLIDQGAFGLDDPVAKLLPAFTVDDAKRTITIRHLLSHTSGLPAWLPIYLEETGPEGYVAAIARAELGTEPGTEVIYSDLGFILLAEIVRHVTGSDIAMYAAREIFAPLDMSTTEYQPPAWRRPEIAATERGNPREIEMTGDRAAQYSHWRQEIIWGSVHDGNSYYGLNGVAGHAGLFGTATDIRRYGQCWLHHGRWEGTMLLSPEIVAEATREQAPGRGLGWRLPAPVHDQDDIIRPLGADAYGHTGFTGTALWVAPALDLVAVLLTNRVHPLSREEITTIRPAFAAALAKAVVS